MAKRMSASAVKRLAGLELNDLLLAGNLPRSVFDRARVSSAGVPIYDISGELLFQRVSLRKGNKPTGYADIAVNPVFGAPFLGASTGVAWNYQAIRKAAVAAARKRSRRLRFDSIRIVAYSFPKLAAQFLLRGKEQMMLELYSWQPVPEARAGADDDGSQYFERWSYLDSIRASRKRSNTNKFERRLAQWDELCPPRRPPRRFRPDYIRIRDFERLTSDFEIVPLFVSRELHYSPDNTHHHPCYELKSQLTDVWCVAASVQMFLDFYRYNFAQTQLATDLGLGTLGTPNGLPYANDADVVTVIENLTNNALDASMNTSPTWSEFVTEINANRPLISFIPRHARTVAGYTRGRSVLGGIFKGLLVYDPWPNSPSTPPVTTTGGTITRWENFDTETYRRTFTAQFA